MHNKFFLSSRVNLDKLPLDFDELMDWIDWDVVAVDAVDAVTVAVVVAVVECRISTSC